VTVKAKFAGWQKTRDGSHFALYNLLEDIPGHPAGSTVAFQTLRAAGYTIVKEA
jgi:hypothetical protein